MAGGVAPGSPVSAANTNQAFLDANGDDVALGKIGFANTDPVSGDAVENIQRESNSVASFIGKALNSIKNALPNWAASQVGTSGDSLKARGDALSAKFHNAFGHSHSGAEGDGAQISGETILNVPLRGEFVEAIDVEANGSSTDVSIQFEGATPSSDPNTKGVVVNAPYNREILRQADGPNEGDQIIDEDGDVVYGRLTELEGVWTLSYFVDKEGVETAFTFEDPTAVRWYYQQLFEPLVDLPVYNPLAVVPSDNASADIPDATATQRGLVSIFNQIFAGGKTFSGFVEFLAQVYLGIETNSSSTGAGVTLSPTKSILRVTNAGLESIAGITAPSKPMQFSVINKTGVDIEIEHSDSGATSILTPTEENLKFPKNACFTFTYDFTGSRWVVSGGAGGGGGVPFVYGSVVVFSGGTDLSAEVDPDSYQQTFYVKSDSGIAIAVAELFGAAPGPGNAARFTVIGTDSDNPVKLPYSDTAWGLIGPFSAEDGILLTKDKPATFERDDARERMVWVGGSLA